MCARRLPAIRFPIPNYKGENQMAITVISQSGPLPITKSFDAPSDDEMILFISGSVYSITENSWVSVEVLLDGQALGALWLFFNFASSHQALVPTMIPITTT